GLDELAPFNPEERIIEYQLRKAGDRKLAGMTVAAFADETASESPAPGGGSVAALLGSLGAALGTMVANLSSHKPGWDERWEEFSRWAERGQRIKDQLLRLMDEDTQAFNRVMTALGMPKGTPEEKAARKAALDRANQGAIEVPFRVMQVASEAFALLEAMAMSGNPASVSDAGVGVLCVRAAIRGAWLNVRINLSGLADKASAASMVAEGEQLVQRAEERERAILALVEKKIG
ncbi:MAG TPA: cyclodeaminase/cyclohydrolase family protein, partial [Gemmatimonadales bacterium]|nr:cyclodeaminase/cyclohydrolase family protein [Gemmatimonadales bacterium]